MRVLLLFVSVMLFHFCACLDDDFEGAPVAGEENTGDGDHVGQVWDHDKKVDQEALLGKTRRKRLADMPPEESRQELRKLVARIDTDGDSLIDRSELVAWLRRVEESYYEREIGGEFQRADVDKDSHVTFQEYTRTFGFPDDAENAHYAERERGKFLQADRDGDGRLDQTEFGAFIHPTRHDYMVGHLVNEYLERYDNNSDGSVSFQEYIAGIAPQVDSDDLPGWVENEKKEFGEVMDKNKDGKLDQDEIRLWIAPSEEEFTGEEADHLILQADKDKDGKLSADEVVEEFDLFMDSQMTDFGHSVHDEL